MRRKLVVGEFNDSFKPIMDGVGLCVENYTRWIDAKYGTACAVVPHVPHYQDRDPFTVLRYPSLPLLVMPPYRLGVPWASPQVGLFLTMTRFTLVHSHSPFVAGRMAARTAARHAVPHVSTFHTKYREDAARVLKSGYLVDLFIRLILRFYSHCDAVWAPSASTAATLREYGYQGDITIAPNGSDMDRPSAAEAGEYARRGRAIMRVGDDRFVFLFVGQHRWQKNLELVVRGLGRLKQIAGHLPFRAVFVGEGRDAPEIEGLAREVGLAAEARFLGRVVDRERLRALYAAADLFLFPSLYDNAPLVMREAAAFAVPAVVARGSSASEVIDDCSNGFVTENEPDAFARRLAWIMERPEVIEVAGVGASRTIYRSWEDIIDWVAGEYERIIASCRPKAVRSDR